MQGLYREISDQGLFGTDRDCRAKFVSKGRGLYQKTEVRYFSVYYMANISVAPFRIF